MPARLWGTGGPTLVSVTARVAERPGLQITGVPAWIAETQSVRVRAALCVAGFGPVDRVAVHIDPVAGAPPAELDLPVAVACIAVTQSRVLPPTAVCAGALRLDGRTLSRNALSGLFELSVGPFDIGRMQTVGDIRTACAGLARYVQDSCTLDPVPIETSYTDARSRLAELLDAATQDREVVVIHRRGHPDVALVAADELAGLVEAAHLLRSPANASRLLAALERALRGDGERATVGELRAELELVQEEG